MAIETEAQQLRTSADPAAIAAVIAAFPPAEQLPPRTNWLQITDWILTKLPKDLEKREAFLIEKVSEAQREELLTIASHNRIREGGLCAVTDYDICIAGGGNPIQALKTALYLTGNHVTYAKSHLLRFTLLLDDVRSEIQMSRPPQLDLFA